MLARLRTPCIRMRRRTTISLAVLFNTHRATVAVQAEFERAVFAKTARTPARGEREFLAFWSRGVYFFWRARRTPARSRVAVLCIGTGA